MTPGSGNQTAGSRLRANERLCHSAADGSILVGHTIGIYWDHINFHVLVNSFLTDEILYEIPPKKDKPVVFGEFLVNFYPLWPKCGPL